MIGKNDSVFIQALMIVSYELYHTTNVIFGKIIYKDL